MDLFKLVKLQEIDKRLMELESLKGDLPEQVDELKRKLTGLKQDLATNRNELEAARKLNRMVEIDIRSLTDKLHKHQEQIYSVKTNKEYDAITLELDNLEKQLEAAELKGVETLEKEEQLAAEVDRLEERLLELEQTLGQKEFELQQKLNETEAEQKVLISKREDITATLDRRLLANYERIRKGKDGIALAEINNYTCSACYATIPAQTVVEVRKMDRPITCEVCGRILIAMNSNNNHDKRVPEAAQSFSKVDELNG